MMVLENSIQDKYKLQVAHDKGDFKQKDMLGAGEMETTAKKRVTMCDLLSHFGRGLYRDAGGEKP